MSKKKIVAHKPEMRKCDCWLDVGACWCEMDSIEKSATRFSVTDLEGNTYSRWETLKEAMDYGRKRLKNDFRVYDNLEQRIIITYGG